APRLAFEGRSANRRNRRRPKVLYTTRTRPSSLVQVNEKSRELIGPSPWKSWPNDYQNSKQNRDQTKQTMKKLSTLTSILDPVATVPFVTGCASSGTATAASPQ